MRSPAGAGVSRAREGRVRCGFRASQASAAGAESGSGLQTGSLVPRGLASRRGSGRITRAQNAVHPDMNLVTTGKVGRPSARPAALRPLAPRRSCS